MCVAQSRIDGDRLKIFNFIFMLFCIIWRSDRNPNILVKVKKEGFFNDFTGNELKQFVTKWKKLTQESRKL